jgi:inner membrane transporter RhtA
VTTPAPSSRLSRSATAGEERPTRRPSSAIDTRASRHPPPHLYFLVSAVFHYLGPAFAVLLFARVDVLGVAWLRIASAALIFPLWRRPWRAFAAQDGEGRTLLLGRGTVLAVMNVCFYTAIDRLALGTVAAIEFLPVIALAAIGARSRRNLAALALAVPGVYLLTDVQFAAQLLGLAVAFAHAGLFALYIVLADRVAKRDAIGGIADPVAGVAPHGEPRMPAVAEPLTPPRAAPPGATPTPARSPAPAAASRS